MPAPMNRPIVMKTGARTTRTRTLPAPKAIIPPNLSRKGAGIMLIQLDAKSIE